MLFIKEWNDSTGSLVTNDGQIMLTSRCRTKRAVGGEEKERDEKARWMAINMYMQPNEIALASTVIHNLASLDDFDSAMANAVD